MGKEELQFSKRMTQALTPAHFLANIMHPIFFGKTLTDDEVDMGK